MIFWSLPSLAAGASATATITVTPTAEGLITATATAGAQQFDPITANNTATVTTTVGPAADLALSLTGFPNPVVAGSNVTYTVAVTNLGPSTATGVIVNDSAPGQVTVLSTNATQGDDFNLQQHPLLDSGHVVQRRQRLAHRLSPAPPPTARSPPPPRSPPRKPTRTRPTTPPRLRRWWPRRLSASLPAGATLTYESGPTNGAIDIGETVTVILRLRNAGNVSTQNLVATLLATNGVVPVPPNTPQTFGVLLPSGFSRSAAHSPSRPAAPMGGTISPTLQLQDGTNTYPPVSFTFTLPNTQVAFANTNTILIPDPAAPNPPYPMASGPAKPYPSAINVSNFVGLLGKVTLTLSNLSHTYPE